SGFDQGDGQAHVEKVHGDAAAHRARANDTHAIDRPRRCVGGDVWRLCRLALGEKRVALRGGLSTCNKLEERCALAGHTVTDRSPTRRFDALNDTCGCQETAKRARVLRTK